ncbi:MAG: hypothetical protein KTR25_10960 [Myxococcales bacterium]|nr:hypothetical protein [Myxococcales bacterium]
MEGLHRLRLSSVVCVLFIRSVPRKRYFADHPSHFSDGLLVAVDLKKILGVWFRSLTYFRQGHGEQYNNALHVE